MRAARRLSDNPVRRAHARPILRPWRPCQPVLFGEKRKIYKVDVPDEDSLLEVVIFLPQRGQPGSNGTDTKHVNATSTTTKAKAKPNTSISRCVPSSVSVLPDGHSVLVDIDDPEIPPTSTASRNAAGGDTGPRRLSVPLPQRVVPGSAKSYFWQGDLTVRAVLSAVH